MSWKPDPDLPLDDDVVREILKHLNGATSCRLTGEAIRQLQLLLAELLAARALLREQGDGYQGVLIPN